MSLNKCRLVIKNTTYYVTFLSPSTLVKMSTVIDICDLSACISI